MVERKSKTVKVKDDLSEVETGVLSLQLNKLVIWPKHMRKLTNDLALKRASEGRKLTAEELAKLNDYTLKFKTAYYSVFSIALSLIALIISVIAIATRK